MRKSILSLTAILGIAGTVSAAYAAGDGGCLGTTSRDTTASVDTDQRSILPIEGEADTQG